MVVLLTLGPRIRGFQLDSVWIVRTAAGKYRKSALYQADDILDLLEHGTEVTR